MSGAVSVGSKGCVDFVHTDIPLGKRFFHYSCQPYFCRLLLEDMEGLDGLKDSKDSVLYGFIGRTNYAATPKNSSCGRVCPFRCPTDEYNSSLAPIGVRLSKTDSLMGLVLPIA